MCSFYIKKLSCLILWVKSSISFTITMFVLTNFVYFNKSLSKIIPSRKPFLSVWGICIPDVLMNITYFCGLSKRNNSKVVLLWGQKIVSYYVSKGFVIAKYYRTEKSIWEGIPIKVKKHVNYIDGHKNGTAISCQEPIYFQVDMLKKLVIS